MPIDLLASPSEIRRKLFGADAARYTIQEYEAKVIRIADGLSSAQAPLEHWEMRYLLIKAQYARAIKDIEPSKHTAFLKQAAGDAMFKAGEPGDKEDRKSVV